MDYEFFTDTHGTEHVVIKHPNGGFTTMHKTVWDELQAAKEAQSL